jgi:quinohemoprotein ethanol dehydrogenase
MRNKIVICVCLLWLACTTQRSSKGWLNEIRLTDTKGEASNWITLGGNYMQQHYSPLDEINADNVRGIGFAWEYKTNSQRGKVSRGLEATPIVIDGIMYTSAAWSIVYAIDAKTGAELWRYDPNVDGSFARNACCDVVNRGVQVWKGKVYVGTLDGFLVCLDASTGTVLWREDTFIDRTKPYSITGPPQIAKDKVIIGNSGADKGVRGYISAYDSETGKFAWRFFIVPGDPQEPFEHEELEMAAKTWDVNSDWEAGGGGTVWGECAYDPELNLLYIGTGNGSPSGIWFRSPNGGDNLFLCSILAINPDSGKLVWHYQTTPGETWDYTSTQNIILADLTIDNEPRKVLMQAPKNGFFYVIDRLTGKLISAEKFVPANWAHEIDRVTGKPLLYEGADFRKEPKYIFPSIYGGHNWHPMSFNPQTGLVYIPSMDKHVLYLTHAEKPEGRGGRFNWGFRVIFAPLPDEYKSYAEEWPVPEGEILKAWDPVKQKEVWRKYTPGTYNGGVLSTAGNLVFQGTPNGFLQITDALTGETIHEIEIGTAVMAAPATYEIDGAQYIAVMAGYGHFQKYPEGSRPRQNENYGRIIAFKLNGEKVPLPPKREFHAANIPAPPDMATSAVAISKGESLFQSYCTGCHIGFGADHFSEVPDLSAMSTQTHQDFNDIVLKGKLSYYGMAAFSDVLEPEDAEAIHMYLISVQRTRYNEIIAALPAR